MLNDGTRWKLLRNKSDDRNNLLSNEFLDSLRAVVVCVQHSDVVLDEAAHVRVLAEILQSNEPKVESNHCNAFSSPFHRLAYETDENFFIYSLQQQVEQSRSTLMIGCEGGHL